MSRSFYRPRPENMAEVDRHNAPYFHEATDAYFTMIERGGKYFQRRYQLGIDGKQINVDEKQIDFVMGSGNHVRTYLHRMPSGEIQQLPLAWYSERGGFWGMNAGYEGKDQNFSLRKINSECMFCHNSYPATSGNGGGLRAAFPDVLPEGIDCQRCHGPGLRHVQAAQKAEATPESLQAVRDAIVNPFRLPTERQMEVCMQCHLETTSTWFPHSILKYDRDQFSYRPGTPLSDFTLNFDHPARPGEDRFEISGSAYRLRLSRCFIQTRGALKCTTCHDPHDIPHDESAPQHYNSVCLQCHTTTFQSLVNSGRHTASGDCVDCHMPKRRTDDVVHAVMTDHYIQRNRPGGNLLAEKSESNDVYRGPVIPYDLAPDKSTSENELYLAVAQVTADTNIKTGIDRLAAALKKYRPAQAQFYNELADAWLRDGQPARAVPAYQEALRHDPESLIALRGLGLARDNLQQYDKAAETLRRAISLDPADALLWRALARTYATAGEMTLQNAALRKSLALDAENPETHFLMGNLLAQAKPGEPGAEASYREAIRLKPNYVEARMNLAILLAKQNQVDEAAWQFEHALRARPDYSLAHFYYGLMLSKAGRTGDALRELRAAVEQDPASADAYGALGEVCVQLGMMDDARRDFTEALRIRPQFDKAELDLGALFATQGDRSRAREHLVKAGQSPDRAIRERATEILLRIPR